MVYLSELNRSSGIGEKPLKEVRFQHDYAVPSVTTGIPITSESITKYRDVQDFDWLQKVQQARSSWNQTMSKTRQEFKEKSYVGSAPVIVSAEPYSRAPSRRIPSQPVKRFEPVEDHSQPFLAAKIAEIERPKPTPPPPQPFWTQKAEEKHRHWLLHGKKDSTTPQHVPVAFEQPHAVAPQYTTPIQSTPSKSPVKLHNRWDYTPEVVSNQKLFTPSPSVRSQTWMKPFVAPNVTPQPFKRAPEPRKFEPPPKAPAAPVFGIVYGFPKTERRNMLKTNINSTAAPLSKSPSKTVNISTLISDEAVQPPPRIESQPNWANLARDKQVAWQQRGGDVRQTHETISRPSDSSPYWAGKADAKHSVWERSAQRIDPQAHKPPAQQSGLPNWLSKAEQTQRLWREEAEAWKKAKEAEHAGHIASRPKERYGSEPHNLHLQTPSFIRGPAEFKVPEPLQLQPPFSRGIVELKGSDPLKSRQWHVSSVKADPEVTQSLNSTVSVSYAPRPAESVMPSRRSRSRHDPADVNRAYEAGVFTDPQGREVTFKKETHTVANPSRGVNLLVEEEKKVIDTPFDDQLVKRQEVITRHYKQSGGIGEPIGLQGQLARLTTAPAPFVRRGFGLSGTPVRQIEPGVTDF